MSDCYNHLCSGSPGAGNNIIDPCVRSVMEVDCTQWTKHCAVVLLSSTLEDQVEDYAITVFSDEHSLEFPICKISDLQPVVYEFQQIFKATPGKTDASYHCISTTGPPVCVPPRRIPIHYREEMLDLLQSMLNQTK